MSLLKVMEGGIHNTMKRSRTAYGSVIPPAPSASSKKTVASVRGNSVPSGRDSDPDLPEAIALRRESGRLANIILDDIRSGKYDNAEEFDAAYRELC